MTAFFGFLSVAIYQPESFILHRSQDIGPGLFSTGILGVHPLTRQHCNPSCYRYYASFIFSDKGQPLEDSLGVAGVTAGVTESTLGSLWEAWTSGW